MATIFDFDPPVGDSRQVEVHFFHEGELVHTRHVNAAFTAGVYDPDLTEDRVEEVARGVLYKLEVGAIQKPSLDNSFAPGEDPEAEKKLTKKEKDDLKAAKLAKRAEKEAAIAARLVKATTRIEARTARKAGV